MVKSMTSVNRIKRAEEIYERRQKLNNFNKNENVNMTNNLFNIRNYEEKKKKEKKEIKLLRRILLQVSICMGIYFVISNIYNSNYVFSNDVINKTKEILSYNTNFYEIYLNSKNTIMNLFMDNSKDKEENKKDNQLNQENSSENTKDIENIQSEDNNNQIGGVDESNEIIEKQEVQEEKKLSEYEKNILDIKNTATFIKPLEGEITSVFGMRETSNPMIPKNHTGIDIGGNIGDKIISSTDGEVVLASSEGGYGKHLKIQIGEVSIIYAHCNELLVKQGDFVKQGQEIATVGSTGNSTGPHLHFEIRGNEQVVNPQDILEL